MKNLNYETSVLTFKDRVNTTLNNRVKLHEEDSSNLVCGDFFVKGRNNEDNINEGVPFSSRVNDDSCFLLQVGSRYDSNIPLGKKLYVLSAFYRAIEESHGEPTAFHMEKNGKNSISLFWSFTNKENSIKMLKEKFNTSEEDTLVIIGEKTILTERYQIGDKTKEYCSKVVGLPFDLYYFVEENIDEFAKCLREERRLLNGCNEQNKKSGSARKR